jgi:hypothetical protein
MNRIQTHANLIGLALLASAVVAAPAFARPASSFYTPQQLKAMSANWAAKGRLLGNPDAASFYTPQQLQALSRNWAAKARLLGRVEPATQVRGDRFDWGDFGIGAAAMLGLVLLGVGTAAAAHFGRRGGMRARPVS